MSQELGFNFDFKGLTVDRLNEYKDEIKKNVIEVLDFIANCNREKSFDNTVQPMINIHTLIESMVNSFEFASSFYPDKSIRDVGSDVKKELSQFFIDQTQRKDVYEAFKEYANKNFKLECDTLTHEERRYVEHTMRDFRRDGLHLNDEELIKMKKELSDLQVEFQKNINQENTSFEFTQKQLEGMPESWFTDDKIVKQNDNKSNTVYKVTLKYPDYIPAIKNVKDKSVRKILYLAFNSRCASENVGLFEKTIKLRYQIAQKLGYQNHADFSTEIKIVKSGQNALDFIEGLNTMFTKLYRKDMAELLTFAQSYKENPLDNDTLEPWSKLYYARAYKEKECNLDLEKVKEYFPLPKVREGLFKIYQTLLSLKFNEVETDNKWHESVKLFSVKDKDSDELLGYFYLDMYPREGKYSHAAAFDFLTGCDMRKVTRNKDSRRRPHVMAMCCNFPEKGCISFEDVVTFFHEFGHVMHQICSRPQIKDYSGFGIEWDFVEAPSQCFEQWVYCKEPLQLMSSHKETGEPMPEDMINKLVAMKKVLPGYNNKGQFMYGIFDLRAHIKTFGDDEIFDSRKLWYETVKDVLEYDLNTIDGCDIDQVASFGHLMSGYAAGYYGYKRAETYAANMFYKVFKDGNVLNPEAGMKLRKKLFEPGSSKDGLDLMKDLLGEEPDDSYFLIDQGLDHEYSLFE
jgi:Zn-dependent oligopeptidase